MWCQAWCCCAPEPAYVQETWGHADADKGCTWLPCRRTWKVEYFWKFVHRPPGLEYGVPAVDTGGGGAVVGVDWLAAAPATAPTAEAAISASSMDDVMRSAAQLSSWPHSQGSESPSVSTSISTRSGPGGPSSTRVSGTASATTSAVASVTTSAGAAAAPLPMTVLVYGLAPLLHGDAVYRQRQLQRPHTERAQMTEVVTKVSTQNASGTARVSPAGSVAVY